MPGLEDQFPGEEGSIANARQYGYSDDEIAAALQRKRAKGLGPGQSVPAPAITQAPQAPDDTEYHPASSNWQDKVKAAAKYVAETGTSVVPALAGGMIGGPIGAAAGAGIGETIRQMIFDPHVNPETIAFAAATGWIPGLKLSGITSPLARIGAKAVEGGVFAGVTGEARKAIEQGKDYNFAVGDTAMNALMGAAFGAGFEKLFPSLPKDVQDKLNAVKGQLPNEVARSQAAQDYKAMAAQLADPATHMAALKSGAAKLNAGQPLTQMESTARGTTPDMFSWALAPEGGLKAGPPTTPVPTSKQMGDLFTGGQMSAEEIAKIFGQDKDSGLADRLVKSGQLQIAKDIKGKEIPGQYEMAKTPPAAPAQPAAQPYQRQGKKMAAPAMTEGATPQQQMEIDYKAGDAADRARMKAGIQVKSDLFSAMQRWDRDIELSTDPTKARTEMASLQDAANAGDKAAQSRLASMGVDYTKQQTMSGERAQQLFKQASTPKIRPRAADEEALDYAGMLTGQRDKVGSTLQREPLSPTERMEQAARQRVAAMGTEEGTPYQPVTPEQNLAQSPELQAALARGAKQPAAAQPAAAQPAVKPPEQAAVAPTSGTQGKIARVIANIQQRMKEPNLSAEEFQALQDQLDAIKKGAAGEASAEITAQPEAEATAAPPEGTRIPGLAERMEKALGRPLSKEEQAAIATTPEQQQKMQDIINQGMAQATAATQEKPVVPRETPTEAAQEKPVAAAKPEMEEAEIVPPTPAAKPEPAAVAPAEVHEVTPGGLDLTDFTPRMQVGEGKNKSYVVPNFARPLEKAAFAASTKGASKYDADLIKYVGDQTGLDEQGVRDLGQKVKEYISANRGGKKTVDVPEIWKPERTSPPISDAEVSMVKNATDPTVKTQADAANFVKETKDNATAHTDDLTSQDFDQRTPQERREWAQYTKENREVEWNNIENLKAQIEIEKQKLAHPEEFFGLQKGTTGVEPLTQAEIEAELKLQGKQEALQQKIKTERKTGVVPEQAPVKEKGQETPPRFANATDQELNAILASPKSKDADLFQAAKELKIRQEKAAQPAAKPMSMDERIAQLEAEHKRLSDINDKMKAAAEPDATTENLNEQSPKEEVSKAVDDALKKWTPFGGGASNDETEAMQAALRRRAQTTELFRLLHIEARQNGLTLEQAAAKRGIPYSALDQMYRQYFYPSEKFKWDFVGTDELRDRQKERGLLQQIYTKAKAQSQPAETIARQMNIDPKDFNNMVHEVKVDDTLNAISNTVRDIKGLNERANFLMAETPAIEQTGTIRPGSKVTAREEVRPDVETYRRKISEAGFDRTRSGILDTLGEIRKIADDHTRLGSSMTAKQALTMRQAADKWAREYNKYSDQWFKDRMAWGRIGKAQQRPPVPADLIQFLTDVGTSINQWRSETARTPVYTALWNARHYNSLSPSDKFEVQNAAVNALRYNVFPLTSSSLDAILDGAELAVQHLAGVGADIGYGMSTGKWSFPNSKAISFAWKNARTAIQNRIYVPEFEEAMKFTAGGEPVTGNMRIRDLFNPKAAHSDYWTNLFQNPRASEGIFKTGQQGAFTMRGNQYSAALDTLAGLPLYLKSAVDNATKRFAGTVSMYSDALKAADQAGLPAGTLQHQLFVKDYWKNIPKDALDRAIDAANSAGFSRELPAFAERMSRSKFGQLFFDAFGRFSWQFLKWTQDMLGANPVIWGKIGTALKNRDFSNLSPEEMGRWLARMATGWGGLALIDAKFYDKTDFQSMEYLDENGDRQRLGSREPIATGLFLDALIHGDWAKAQLAARYASFPLLKGIYGDGGLLSNALSQVRQAQMAGRNPLTDLQVQRELTDIANKYIPGQAILAAIKTPLDPTTREGFGSELPGISRLTRPKIDLTTGEPLEVMQHLPGPVPLRGPAIQGTPIPGMFREMNPISQMMMRYGFTTYRANRLPIAGQYPSEAPQEVNREWQIEFGKLRNQFQSKLAPIVKDIESRTPPDQLKPGAPVYEAIRARISAYDSMAAREANQIINYRYQTSGKLPRRVTTRELAQPVER